MLLAINIGNSKIAVGCMEDREVLYRFSLASDTAKTSDEYAVLLGQLLALGEKSAKELGGAAISSVVPVLTDVLADAVVKLTGKKPLIVGAGVKTGLNIKTENPAQLGCDLAVTAVGALDKYPAPLVIVSMGTATTFTVLDKDGGLIGVAIAPGVGLALSALSTGTSLLPHVRIDIPKNCIGTNTVDCMRSGAVFGTASMIDGMVARIEEILGYPTSVVAMGDHAPLITSVCSRDVILDNDLLFCGLSKIYQKNRKK